MLTSVHDKTRARQWTATLKVQPDDVDELIQLHTFTCKKLGGSLLYCFVGGLEKTEESDYHVHAIYKFKHPRQKDSVVQLFDLHCFNVYITPTDKKPLKYYVMHHAKEDTKVDPTKRITFEWPIDSTIYDTCLQGKQWTVKDKNTRKNTMNDKILDSMELSKQGKLEPTDDCTKDGCCVYHKYPKIYLEKRQQLCALNPVQIKPKGCVKKDNLWIYGPTGCGKTSSVFALFQKEGLYRRDITKPFWQSYGGEPNVVIEDVNNSTLRQIKLTTLKNLCDPTGFPIEQKYGNSEIIQPRIIITSQYSIDECVEYVGKNSQYFQDWYHQEDLDAVKRRFRCIEFHDWLFEQNLQVVDEDKANELDKQKCNDPMQYLEPYNIEHPNGITPPMMVNKRKHADISKVELYEDNSDEDENTNYY